MNQAGQAGFTLLEVLMSIAVIAVLTGITAPVYISFQNRNTLDNTTQTVVESIRRAETFARSGRGDSNWGVKFQTGSVVIYKGAAYTSRDTTADDTVSLSGAVALSGLGEINFAELTGAPVTAGSVVLTSSTVNESDTVTVNSEGMVTF